MLRKIIIILCSFSSLAFAEIDQKSLDAANELADLLGLTNQMEANFDAMTPIVMEQVKQMNLNDDQTVRLMGIYKSWYTEDLDLDFLAKKIVELYAQTFSVKELKELTAFYKTPLGKKAYAVFPELMAKGAKLGAIECQKRMPELSERLKPLMEELNK